MSRMKTFLIYALLIVGFIAFSYIVENGFIYNMYKTISGTIDRSYQDSSFETELLGAKASNVSGFITLKVKNTTGSYLDKYYTKVNLYSKLGLLSATKYYEVTDFAESEERTFEIKFKADEITNYEISFAGTVPDKTNIINILGWEIDLTNIFGIDLTKYSNLENIKSSGTNAWNWTISFLNSVPAWAYFAASLVVLWHLPTGYLFGIFPF